MLDEAKSLHYYFYSIGPGALGVSTYALLNEVDINVFKRFRNVFELAYRRFIDIEQAEAQAREAKIEAALERVRSRTMGMQKSEELKEVIQVIYEQFGHLNINIEHAGIIMDYKARDDMNIWLADQHGAPSQVTIPYFDSVPWNRFNEAKEKGMDFFAVNLTFEEKNRFYQKLFKYIPGLPEEAKEFYFSCPGVAISTVLLENVSLYIENFSGIPYSDEENNTLMRFGNVFQQTYTRFNDLQKAEAQAREAQIEASLEKVRSSAMAMHYSNDISSTTTAVFEELGKLNVKSKRCGIALLSGNSYMGHVYAAATSSDGKFLTLRRSIDMTQHQSLQQQYETWKKQENYFIEMNGDELKSYYQLPFFYSSPDYVPPANYERTEYGYYIPFPEGLFYAWTENPYTEDEINILKRFKRIVALTFRRFFDLQKAEAQAREAKIEAGLERVRSRTMAMQKSEELKEVIQLVYEQFIHLNINIEHTGFVMDYKARDDWDIWIADQLGVPSHVTIPYFDSVWGNRFNEAKEKGMNFFAYNLGFEEKNRFYQKLIKYIPGVSEEAKEFLFSCPGVALSIVLLENVCLYIENFSGISYSDEENATLMRFGKVFQQTYTRFFDLQKAEAQAREAKIEAALERTRTQSMIMQHSNELDDTLRVFHEQVLLLGINSAFSFLWLPDEDKERHIFWAAWAENNSTVFRSKAINYPLDRNEPATAQCLADWKSNEPVYSYHVPPAAVENYFAAWQELIDGVEQLKPEYFSDGLYYVEAFMKYGCFGVMVATDLTEDEKKILGRFAIEFERTYTRFLDLQKAEAQAREAKIESALERVRAKAMAMLNSEDLALTVSLFFVELNALNVTPHRCGVSLVDKESRIADLTVTVATEEGQTKEMTGKLKLTGHPVLDAAYDHWINQKEYHPVLHGDEIKKYYQVMNPQVEFPDFSKDTVQFGHYFSFKEGFVFAWTEKELMEEELQIFRKFTSVLSLTYRRYMDLKDAEAQAREAQIELALEKVRARTMAMQQSNELKEVVVNIFEGMNKLGFDLAVCNIALINNETYDIDVWTAHHTDEGVSTYNVRIPYFNHPFREQLLESFRKEIPFSTHELSGELKKSYDHLFIKYVDISNVPDDVKLLITELPEIESLVLSAAYMKQGLLIVSRTTPATKYESDILQRFAKVFEQTYTRFLDLKNAEAQAIEAMRQASLDRVRAEIASMRTTEDLNRITPIIWSELKTLDVPFIRCGVFIVDETSAKVRVYLTTPDGRSLAVLNLPIDANELTINAVENWRKGIVYKGHWNREEFINWTKSMIEQGQIQNAETYQGSANPPESLDLHFVPFTQGMLYIGNTSPLTEEKIQLVKSLAEAFSIAYARYEDFKNLEEAKNKVEVTLNELKSAQVQLIHSEKMASLGELTAGIAHEIKNPLNFVNNFSEISRELLDELKAELQNDNKEEVIAIAEDLKQNLEKINQHGKRADSIVKGMLLHSRGTSGEKVLTNINDLLEQYVTLAYHGLRAQDKEFNISIEKDYDKSLEKINVVQQDISRVFLNIINNACYAAHEKKRKSSDGFIPILKVSTKNLEEKVEIRIQDNGNGIPASTKEQIFNPFFTTKPTGEGTGLGLSLSYDIVVKQHAGEIKFETEEGKYTEFIIILPKV